MSPELSDLAAARKVGLNPDMNLPQECADFYVLEGLFNELYPWDGDSRFPKGMFPAEFSGSSRVRMRAYDVAATLKGRKARLAKEFSTYLAIACGGELRHIGGRLGKEVKVLNCKHAKTDAHKQGDCCSHRCWPVEAILPPVCGCLCPHAHGADWPCALERKGCQWGCCGHSCKESPACFKTTAAYKPSKRVMKYLEECDKSSPEVTGTSRHRGWQVWHALAKNSPVAWMLDCADAFDQPSVWGEGRVGYGGEAWGSAAAIVASYYRGDITEQTFIDRCWSLEHNNGTIFNKVYPSASTFNREGSFHLLRDVLDRQHNNDYKTLVGRYCSPHVKGLWTTHEAAMGRWSVEAAVYLSKLAFDAPTAVPEEWHGDDTDDGEGLVSGLPGQWPFKHNVGCMYCWWKLVLSGVSDPCNGVLGEHGVGTLNAYCAYRVSILPDLSDATGLNLADIAEEYCVACLFNAVTTMLDDGTSSHDPCSSGLGMTMVDVDCGYYGDVIAALTPGPDKTFFTPTSWPWNGGDYKGCLYCWWTLVLTGAANPCHEGNHCVYATSTSSASTLQKLLAAAEMHEEELSTYCLACLHYYLVSGIKSPCAMNGGPFTASVLCAFYPKILPSVVQTTVTTTVPEDSIPFDDPSCGDPDCEECDPE